MIKLILILPFFCVCFNVEKNKYAEVDNRYLFALIRTKTDPQITQEIKKTFPYLTKKRSKCLDFNLNSEIKFLPISYFERALKNKDLDIDFNLIEDGELFRERYHFEPYTLDLFKTLIPESDSRLHMTFSKPFQSILLAEILDSELNKTWVKMGSSLQILFIFNENGTIEDILFANPYYN